MVSALQLSKEIGVTYKTAWFLLHRIREACKDDNLDNDFLFGTIEADEVYIGGKEKNKHASKKLDVGGGTTGKAVVLGMRTRKGQVKAKAIYDNSRGTIQNVIQDTVCINSTLCTDEHKSYQGIPERKHKTVNHSAKQYVDGMAYTNGIESVWALVKRGFYGIYHAFRKKHLQRYLNEFVFRLNSGNVKVHTLDRITTLIGMCFGKRLSYETLVT